MHAGLERVRHSRLSSLPGRDPHAPEPPRVRGDRQVGDGDSSVFGRVMFTEPDHVCEQADVASPSPGPYVGDGSWLGDAMRVTHRPTLG